jgi:DnaJ-domain-containing protein 1
MQAIAKTIDALRGIERWGTGDMIEAAFRGFTALPNPEKKKSWRDVFGFSHDEHVDADKLRQRYRELASKNHPDRGGNSDAMANINAALKKAEAAI